jgi:hypothetical protein
LHLTVVVLTIPGCIGAYEDRSDAIGNIAGGSWRTHKIEVDIPQSTKESDEMDHATEYAK